MIEQIVADGAPDVADRLRAAPPPRGTRTWLGHHGFIRRPFGPGWALVGDAGYFKDPISAHGITDALRDAELLARAVVDGFSEPPRRRGARRVRVDACDRLSIPLFDVVDRIASHHGTTPRSPTCCWQLSVVDGRRGRDAEWARRGTGGLSIYLVSVV